jgi:hypothetical protein
MRVQLIVDNDALEYVIKHDPVRYMVKSKFLFFYQIFNIQSDSPVSELFFWKALAESRCDLLNIVYQVGYQIGVSAVIKLNQK